jgi:DNA mismatch repair ATPase MutS
MDAQAATRCSIVALDELGRGTATTDGAAVASAVLSHLANRVSCRGLFATHYHRLSEEHAVDRAVSLFHMGCCVEPAKEGVQLRNLRLMNNDACNSLVGAHLLCHIEPQKQQQLIPGLKVG